MATVFQGFQRDTNKLLRNSDTRDGYDRRFCFSYGNQRVALYHGLQERFDNTSFWRGTHLLVSFTVPQPSEYSWMTELNEEYSPPCTVQYIIYILQTIRLRSNQYIAS